MMDAADRTVAGESPPDAYRFDDIVVDVHAQTVERAGMLQPVEPKAYAVLLELLRRPHELVTRDELLDAVWGHRHVTPGVLTRAIAQLRNALDDDPHQPRYIRTRHALGYCFIGDLAPPGRTRDAVPPDPVATAPPGSTAAETPSATPRQARHWPLLAGIALVVVLAVVAAHSLLPERARDRAAGVPAHAATLAVLPFAATSGGADARYFAEGFSIALEDSLSRVRGLRLTPVPRRRDGQAPHPRAVGRRLGVAHVLEASVDRTPRSVTVSARIIDPRTGAVRWSGRFERDAAKVMALEAELAAEVAAVVAGAAAAPVRTRPGRTASALAYAAYLDGLQSLQAGEGEAGRQRAIAAFERALSLDRGFAGAQAGLCRAWIERFDDLLSAPAYAPAEAACRRAAAMAPELREVDLALGNLHRARGNHERAIAHFTRALDDVALRAQGEVGLARSWHARGDDARAQRHFERALHLSPNDAGIHREHGHFRYTSGDPHGAAAAYSRAAELAPHDERIWSSLGGLHLATGDVARARDAFTRSLAVRPNYAALSNFGSLLYEARDYAGAATHYRRAAALDPADFRIWGNLGDALAAQPGRGDDARAAYEHAARLAGAYVRIRGDDAQSLALLGWYLANLGDAAGARARLAQAESLGSEPAEVAFLGAQILAVLRDDPAVRIRVARAMRGGVTRTRLEASPVLRPLLHRPAT